MIASNVTSIPEVGGDAALYVDPLEVGQIAAAMLRLIDDAALRERLAQLGHARARQFSWEETALQTLAIYERCLSQSTSA